MSLLERALAFADDIDDDHVEDVSDVGGHCSTDFLAIEHCDEEVAPQEVEDQSE